MLVKARALIYGAAAAVLILAAGFGAMSILYMSVPYDHALRGLYSYRSATWGDAVLLPLAGMALIFAIASAKRASRDWVAGMTGCGAGTIGGLLVQRAWLTDPDVNLNWTLPSPGHFNVAGWYHAVFLVLMSSFFLGCLMLLTSAAVDKRLTMPSAAGAGIGPLRDRLHPERTREGSTR
ncbi:hypothetical protein GCM10022240_29680 [Microbacterium kribbense]|uniref:Uncharacterized protein n=1 Tax=Microbacterium kribbense TaxID=433645 RepID=A0ABP7GUK7_9MICO